MGKSISWVNLCSPLCYLFMQSFYLFYGIIFVFHRFGIETLPEIALIWYLITIALIFIPLHYLEGNQQYGWFAVIAISSIGLGYFLFGNFLSPFLLVCGGVWLSSHMLTRTHTRENFLVLFAYGIVGFALAKFFALPFFFTQEELNGYLHMIFGLVVLIILGNTFDNLSGLLEQRRYVNRTWMRWFLANGVVLGAISLVAAIASLLSYWVSGLVHLVGTGIEAGLIELGQQFLKLAPFLQNRMQEIPESLLGNENTDPSQEESDGELPPLEHEVNPLMEAILSIVPYIFGAIFIGIIIIWLIRKVYHSLILKEKPERGSKSIVREPIVQNSLATSGNLLFNQSKKINMRWFGKVEHPVRRQFRELLLTMRKKDLWPNDSISVGQLTDSLDQLKKASPLYEKVRYGKQELTQEEMVLFQHEVENLLKNLKQYTPRDRKHEN